MKQYESVIAVKGPECEICGDLLVEYGRNGKSMFSLELDEYFCHLALCFG